MGKHVATALKTRTAKSTRFRNFCYGLANCKSVLGLAIKLSGLGEISWLATKPVLRYTSVACATLTPPPFGCLFIDFSDDQQHSVY